MSKNLKEVLIKNNFRFNKQFGQNFISDVNLLDAIVTDGKISSEDIVVEVGAGGGTLTEALSKAAKKVISYEIDNNLKPILQERLEGLNNVEMRFQDIMKVDTRDLTSLDNFKVVANLPYYITTPITMFFLEEVKNAESITIMVQKEVAERFSAKAGSENYGAITIVVDYYGEAQLKRVVNRNMFYPVPKVDSAVLHIKRREKYFPKSEKTFLKTVKSAFAMRRKTLSNNLMTTFDMSREKVNQIIERAGFSPSIRGEKLTTADFVLLSDEVYKEINE